MPNEGGLSDQPALFLPLMSLVSNAVQQERELAEQDKKRKDELIERTKRNTGQQSGSVSILNGGDYASIPVPGMKGS